MKEYKGLYHNTQEKTKYFEYGALFKYSELYNALKNLQSKQEKENSHLKEKINSPLKNENKEKISTEKKRKKYKLKTLNIEENNRYLITDVNNKDDEKNKFGVIEEEQENKKTIEIRRNNRFFSKSLDKVHLPNINSNNLNTLQNHHLQTDSNETNFLYQSHEFHRRNNKINFPKLNALHTNNIFPDNHNIQTIVETQSRFQDNGAIKIFNDFDLSSKSKHSHKKRKDKIFPKLHHLNNDNEEKSELLPRSQRKTDRLTSIFEKEKMIKNNNLFLGEKNSYMNKEEREIMNDHMAQQIHNLKMQLLGNSRHNLKRVYQ